MFVWMKSQRSSKMGHVCSKTKSLGQILEKPCARSIGNIFSQMIMKLGQNVCLDQDWDGTRLKMGHVESKSRSLG